MAVINIRKDGTVIEDMSEVTVPKEIVKNMIFILQKKKEEEKENQKNG